MIGQTLLIIIIAFIAYMHSFIGSTMHNRPIVVAPLVGLILGDLHTGIICGATLELIFMGAIPIGASNPPDFVSGTIIATAFVIMTGEDVSSAALLAIPIATLVLFIDNLQMTFLLTGASHQADKYAAKGDVKGVERVHLIAAIGNKLILSLIVGLGFFLGVPVIEKILDIIPDYFIHGMDVAAGILPAIGFAMLVKMMISKQMIPFLGLGFLLAAYLNVTVLGIALFATCIAIYVFYQEEKTVVEVDAYDNEF